MRDDIITPRFTASLDWDWECPNCGYVNERWGDIFRTRVCDHCGFSPDGDGLPDDDKPRGIE